jgi:hypothetical protein
VFVLEGKTTDRKEFQIKNHKCKGAKQAAESKAKSKRTTTQQQSGLLLIGLGLHKNKTRGTLGIVGQWPL